MGDVRRTNLLLTSADDAIIERLKRALGMTSTASVVRLAIREMDERLHSRRRAPASRRAAESGTDLGTLSAPEDGAPGRS